LRCTLLLTLSLMLASAPQAAADVPATMAFQGYLASAGGDPISGPVDILFRIYDQQSGGDPLWQESHSTVVVSNGLFTVLLGSVTAFPADLFSGPERYLGVTVDGGGEMAPRQQIAAVPYAHEAHRAADAVTLGGHPPEDFAAADHTHPPDAPVGVDFAMNAASTQLSRTTVDITSVEISAPSAGWVQVTIMGQFRSDIDQDSGYQVTCEASISLTAGSINDGEKVSWVSRTDGEKDAFSRIAIFEVNSGDTTFFLTAESDSSSWNERCYLSNSTISALFVPNRF